MPSQTLPASWQVEHPLVMPAWIIAAVGGGVMKPLPGTLLAPRINVVGRLPRWQLSHLVELGMCEVAPGALDDGMTTRLEIPKNALALTFGPWQVSQPELMPLWLKAELLKRAPLVTGRLVMLELAPT